MGNRIIDTKCAIFSTKKVLKLSNRFQKRTLHSRHSTRIFKTKEGKTKLQIKKLFIKIKAPDHEVSIDTLWRWIYNLCPGSQLLKHSHHTVAATGKAKN